MAVTELHDRVAVCGEVPKVTLVGTKAPHDKPAGDEVSPKVTVPVNPF